MSKYKFESANEAFVELAELIYTRPDFNVSPRGRATKENLGVSVEITNPYQRYVTNKHRSLSLHYIVGEWLWYERGSNRLEEISYYSKFWNKISDDGVTVNSAYGYRILGNEPTAVVNQWNFAKNELLHDPGSRRAICIIASSNDMVGETKDFPCTVYLQFFIRNSRLYLSANMRSNDLVLGLPNDIAAFTLLQEKMLIELRKSIPGLTMGSYYHYAGSLHIYENNFGLIESVLSSKNENINISLPLMNDTSQIANLQHNEKIIRLGSRENLIPLTDKFCAACQEVLLKHER